MHNSRRKSFLVILSRVLIYVNLFIAIFIILFPLFWIVSTSFKSNQEVYSWPPNLISDSPSFSSYVSVWKAKNFSRFFVNSTIVSLVSTLLSALLSVLAAYGFSRFKFRGNELLLFSFLITQMVPAILLLLPYFITMRLLSLINTHLGLIIAYTSFSLPFCTWMLKGFLDSIPDEIDDAALIDGCSRAKALFKVVLPLALPGIASTALYTFLVAWNHYLFALGLATNPNMYTLPVGIGSLIGEFRIEWNELMAAAAIGAAPAILIYIVLQKYFVEGLTGGAVKG